MSSKLIKPEATSTPNYTAKVKGRRGIRDGDISVESPIQNERSVRNYTTKAIFHSGSIERSASSDGEYSPRATRSPKSKNHSRSHEDLSYSDAEDVNSYDSDSDFEQQSDKEPVEQSSWFANIACAIIVVCVAIGAVVYFIDPKEDNKFNNPKKSFDDRLSELQKTFQNQEEDFWITLKVSIKEVSILDQPRTVLLVYDKNAEKTVDKVINDVSKVAVCELTDCSKSPVVISGPSLNKSELIEDYGKIISKYRNDLSKNGVMVVKNLEKVPGTTAQAFHSFCDDYNPVVKNALILFTLNINDFSDKNKMRNVEQYLLKLWNDISVDDKFYPLFTRISSTVLTVNPEARYEK